MDTSLSLNILNRLKLWLFRKRWITIIDQLPDSGRIVDVGCGYGLLIVYASQFKQNATFVGIDTNEQRINLAQKQFADAAHTSFFHQDTRNFTFNKADTIVMLDVLHHIPYKDHISLFKKIADDVGTQGRLIIADIKKSSGWRYWASYLSDVILYPFSTRCQFYSSPSMHSMLTDAGWKIIHEESTIKGELFSSALYSCRTQNSTIKD